MHWSEKSLNLARLPGPHHGGTGLLGHEVKGGRALGALWLPSVWPCLSTALTPDSAGARPLTTGADSMFSNTEGPPALPPSARHKPQHAGQDPADWQPDRGAADPEGRRSRDRQRRGEGSVLLGRGPRGSCR